MLVRGVWFALHVCTKPWLRLAGIKTILNEFVAYNDLGRVTTNMVWYASALSLNLTTAFDNGGLWIMNGSDVIDVPRAELQKGHVIFSSENETVISDVFLPDGIMSVSVYLYVCVFLSACV